MKKTIIALVIGLLAASAQMAFAGYTVTAPWGYGIWQSNGGGEFTLEESVSTYSGNYSPYTKNQGITPSFQSFCLTGIFTVIFPHQPYDATLSNVALAGAQPDPLSKGTAYLYEQFATGSLNYDYTNASGNRVNNAFALQDAIWYLEDEQTSLADPSSTLANNYYLALALAEYGDLSGAQADYHGTQVHVLNLTDPTPGSYFPVGQDQLVYTPTPIPAAAWLLGSGLLGLIGIKRKTTMRG